MKKLQGLRNIVNRKNNINTVSFRILRNFQQDRFLHSILFFYLFILNEIFKYLEHSKI